MLSNAVYAEIAPGGLAYCDAEFSTTLETPSLGALKEIATLLRELPASWQNGPFVWERRNGHRAQFTELIQLTPLDEETQEAAGETHSVQGRDLSLHGASFIHQEPLPFRTVGLTFDLPSGARATIILRLTWCRFTRQGWYESGGRFLKPICVPL